MVVHRSTSRSLLLVVILSSVALLQFAHAKAYTCGSQCRVDTDCSSNIVNPCTFCLEGTCSPMCGVGCRSDSDCSGGDVTGANPCTMCSSARVCVNPRPQCGSFCGYGVDSACRFNGSNTLPCAQSLTGAQCCQCHPTNLDKGCGNWASNCNSVSCTSSANCTALTGNCTSCVAGKCQMPSQSKCGTICSGSGQCQGGDGKCTQCIGYYCSEPDSSGCGTVCISNGQCQSFSKCTACVSTTCQQPVPCGGACGSDSWCSGSCPVCNRVAQCATSF